MSAARVVHLSTARTMRELPYDPCPGDVAGVRGLARWCSGASDEIADASRVVGGWSPPRWRGDAALAAAGQVVELAGSLRDVARSLAAAADGLDGWAGRLGGLQAQADALDAEAVALRWQLDAEAVEAAGAVVRSDVAARGLRQDLQRVVDRAGRLHQEYAAAAGHAAGALDAAAPADRGALDRWWRGTWDSGLDRHREGARREARYAAWTAEAASLGSTAAAVLSLVPPLATATVPLSTGLSLEATTMQGLLVVGAGGTTEALGQSATSTAVSVAGAGAAGVAGVRGVAAAGGVPGAAQETADFLTYAGLASEVDGWSASDRGEPWVEQRTGVGGGAFDVTVHDVEQPWHAGVGWRGHGYAAVAMVATRTSGAPVGPGPAPTTTRGAAPTTTRGAAPTTSRAPAPTSRTSRTSHGVRRPRG